MRKIEKAPVVVMNFSGAYQLEPFAHSHDFLHIDCTDLHGTDCVLTHESARIINQRIRLLGPRGIHFIDSGDYHYMTKLWTDKIKEPFTLVLVDHHTDMQLPQVRYALTCGDWVDAVIRENRHLKKVIIIGPHREAYKDVPLPYLNKVSTVSPADFRLLLKGKVPLQETGPIYLSIDKDVLDPSSAVTNWDQGHMTLAELHRLVTLLMDTKQMIGIDVCGEFATMHSLFEAEKAATIDSLANETILDAVNK